MSELIIYLDQCQGRPGDIRPLHGKCPAREAWVPLSRCTCHLRLVIPCTFCGEPYHGRCAHCHRPGEPYEYHGITFDGLTAYKGERLCPACRDAIMAVEGVNIRIVDRGGIDCIRNSVRDADLVTPIAAAYRYADYRPSRRTKT